MNFIYPQFLWALLAIAIPIIIHLFNFRKFKKVYFSDVSLLKQVELETSKKSNLKHLLILMARILAIAALVFAFAQPYWKNTEMGSSVGEKIVSIYVDNSLSMNNKWNEFSLLDNAKKQARNVAERFEQNDKFQLLTNDLKPIHQRFLTKEEFLNEVDEIESSSASLYLSRIEQKQLDFLKKENGENKLGYYISDFQKSTADWQNLKLDSTIRLSLIPIASSTLGNVYIDSVWFDSPVRMINKKEKLLARIVNSTSDDIQLKVELTLNGQVKGLLNQDVLANSEQEISLDYMVKESGNVEGKLQIAEYPDPNAIFDDSYFFSYLLKKESKILVINESSKNMDGISGNINQLFRDDSYFKVENSSASSVDFSKFEQSDLIILNEVAVYSSGFISELLGYLESGGTLLMVPSTKADIASNSELLLATMSGRISKMDTANTAVSFLDFDNPFFKDVFQKIPKNLDLPSVSQMYSMDFPSQSNKRSLIKTQNGKDFLASSSYKKGTMYVLAVPFSEEYSNFTSHSLFVTTLLRIAESSGVSLVSSITTQESSVRIRNEGLELEKLSVSDQDNRTEFIPETELNGGEIEVFLGGKLPKAGSYMIKSGKELAYSFGVNYDRSESDFTVFSAEDLKQNIKRNWVSIIENSDSRSASSGAEIAQSPQKLWKWFLWIALLFLAIEIALIKWMN